VSQWQIPPPPAIRGTTLETPAKPKYVLAVPCAYLVSYELKAIDEGHNYLPFILELQDSLDWWHYIHNLWIVVRRDTLTDFSTTLLAKLHSKDRLVILPAKGPAVGWLTSDAWEWLNKTLKNEWG